MNKKEAIETLRNHSIEYEEIDEAVDILLAEIKNEHKNVIMLEERLRHLFKSKTISMYDEKVNNKYVKDIEELDAIVIQKAIPQFVINADNDTVLIFETDVNISPSEIEKLIEKIETKTGCKCLIKTPEFKLKHVILKERNDLKCQEKQRKLKKK